MDKKIIKSGDTNIFKTQISPTQMPYFSKQYR